MKFINAINHNLNVSVRGLTWVAMSLASLTLWYVVFKLFL